MSWAGALLLTEAHYKLITLFFHCLFVCGLEGRSELLALFCFDALMVNEEQIDTLIIKVKILRGIASM